MKGESFERALPLLGVSRVFARFTKWVDHPSTPPACSGWAFRVPQCRRRSRGHEDCQAIRNDVGAKQGKHCEHSEGQEGRIRPL